MKYVVGWAEEGDDSLTLRQVEAKNESLAALQIEKVRELLRDDALQDDIEEDKLDSHIDTYDLSEINDKLSNTGCHLLEVLQIT
jgi:hypothetical protein